MCTHYICFTIFIVGNISSSMYGYLFADLSCILQLLNLQNIRIHTKETLVFNQDEIFPYNIIIFLDLSIIVSVRLFDMTIATFSSCTVI